MQCARLGSSPEMWCSTVLCVVWGPRERGSKLKRKFAMFIKMNVNRDARSQHMIRSALPCALWGQLIPVRAQS